MSDYQRAVTRVAGRASTVADGAGVDFVRPFCTVAGPTRLQRPPLGGPGPLPGVEERGPFRPARQVVGNRQALRHVSHTIVSDTPRVRFETQLEGAGPRLDRVSAICDGTQYRYLRVAV